MSENNTDSKFQDRLVNFLKSNIKLIVVLLVFILLILFSFFLYISFQEKKHLAISEQYNNATILISQEKTDRGKILLENIIKQKNKFYSPLALYLLIDKKIEKDQDKIIEYFDSVIEIKAIGKENINLIKIKKALYLFETKNEKMVIKTLNPIINSDSIWRVQATNIMIDYFLSNNEKLKADEYLLLLKNSKTIK